MVPTVLERDRMELLVAPANHRRAAWVPDSAAALSRDTELVPPGGMLWFLEPDPGRVWAHPSS